MLKFIFLKKYRKRIRKAFKSLWRSDDASSRSHSRSDSAANKVAIRKSTRSATGSTITALNRVFNYTDDQGNVIEYAGNRNVKQITFRGRNNRMVVHENANLAYLKVDFDCDDGYLEIGPCSFKRKGIRAHIRVGQSSRIVIGADFTCTSCILISAVEYSEILIGDDCMIASENEIKTDDSHPIFDVRTGHRVNMPRSIVLGNHVWLARRAVVLGGAEIGDGSVIGYNSVVKRAIPNNCVAVGSPARVIRKHIAWERPHLSLSLPYDKPHKDSIPHSQYWNLTAGEQEFPEVEDPVQPSNFSQSLQDLDA